jgi:hypothetical protein
LPSCSDSTSCGQASNQDRPRAGAKGQLAYYRYNRTSGPTAEVGVIIKVAQNQLVTLRFLAPNSPGKLDKNFSQAVEHIFSSLTITE